MRSLRRLPPVLRVLAVMSPLAFLASLAVATWAWRLGQEGGKLSEQLNLVMLSLLGLGMACNWPVTIYNVRSTPFRRARRWTAWLDAWQGQLLSALGLGALPIATIVAALVISPTSPLFSIAFVFTLLSLLVCGAAYLVGLGQ